MKSFLRRKYIEIRNNLSSEFILNAGEKIVDVFSVTDLFNHNNYMAYYPIKNETPIIPLIKYLIKNSKKISLPITDENDSIIPVNFNDFNDITLGKYKIPEPRKRKPVIPEDIEVVFVPGVVFNKSGQRIGYGKGCYDRFLSSTTLIKVGVCYEKQISDILIEDDEHDIKMDFLLTENALYEV